MKKVIYLLSLSLLLWPAFGTQVKAANENGSSAADTGRQQKQVYQGKVDAKLRDLDRKIDALQQKIDVETKFDRKQLNQQMADLNRKRRAAHQELDKLASSSQEAWQDMKVGISAAMKDLESAYEKAALHFSSQESK